MAEINLTLEPTKYDTAAAVQVAQEAEEQAESCYSR